MSQRVRTLLAWAALAAMLLVLGSGTSAYAAQRFYLGGMEMPRHMITGPDGAVWFNAWGGIGRVGRDGDVTRVATGVGWLYDMTVGPDDAVWFTSDRGTVGRVTTAGQVTEFSRGIPGNAVLGGIVAGPDGAIWFAMRVPVPGPPATFEGRIVRMSADGGLTTVATVPEAEVSDLVVGPGGDVWFTSSYAIGKVSGDGKLTMLRNLVRVQHVEFPSSIVVAADGRLWAAGLVPGKVVTVSLDGRISLLPAPEDADALVPLPDGTMWVNGRGPLTRMDGRGRVVQRVHDSFGARTGCSYSEPIDVFTGGLALDGAGQLWAADFQHDSLLRVTAADPAAPGPLTPILPNRGVYRRVQAVAAGSDAVWATTRRAFVRFGADRRPVVVRRIGARRHVVDLAVAGNGDVWFTEWPARLGRLTPTGHIVTYRRGLPKDAGLGGIALGARGSVWFAGRRFVGRLTPGSGRIRVYRRGLPRHPEILDVAPGPHGAVWFTDQGARVGRISRAGRIRTFAVRRRSNPVAITPGPDGAMWFTMLRGHRIGRITPGGKVRAFYVGDEPTAITAGRDGALWFTTGSADEADMTLSGVGRITTSGRVRRFYVRPTCFTSPYGIAQAPDGALWFDELGGPVGLARLDPAAIR